MKDRTELGTQQREWSIQLGGIDQGRLPGGGKLVEVLQEEQA